MQVVQRLKTCTVGRADSVFADGFGFRQVSTESAAGISASEAYPRASIEAGEATAAYICKGAEKTRNVAVAAAISVYPSLRLLRRGGYRSLYMEKARRDRKRVAVAVSGHPPYGFLKQETLPRPMHVKARGECEASPR